MDSARRRMLKLLGGLLGSAATGSLASGCVPALVDPEAITRVRLREVPQGRRIIMHANRRVELLREGDTITARLMVCTHEFCDLTWLQNENNYHCTCHAAKFFPDGRPKSGPVEKPMFELPARVDGDELIVGPAGELTFTG